MLRLALLLALLLIPTMASANGGRRPWTEIDAQAAIERCWTVGQDKRDSGTTPVMREGTEETIECLEAEIMRHTSEFFIAKDAAEVQDRLDTAHKSLRGLYWALYNNNQACSPSCGTMYYVLPASEIAGLWEDILRNIIRERNQYQQ